MIKLNQVTIVETKEVCEFYWAADAATFAAIMTKDGFTALRCVSWTNDQQYFVKYSTL